MGIKGLLKLVREHAPKAVKKVGASSASNTTIAVDTSMLLYQFLTAIRTGSEGNFEPLASGQTGATSHLLGLCNRVVRFVELGIRPVFVFDGKPPEEKKNEVEHRRKTFETNRKELEAALATGDEERAEKLAKRTVRVSAEQSAEAAELLRLFGATVLVAPSEAEAQCAELAKANRVDVVATDDSDALVFGTPVVLRTFNPVQSSANKETERIERAAVLAGLGLDEEQFLDLCLLCGSDYSAKLSGVGPQNALKIVKTFGSLSAFLEALNNSEDNSAKRPKTNKGEKEKLLTKFGGVEKDKLSVFAKETETARRVFQSPLVTPASDIKESFQWKKVDFDGLRQFLTNKSFNEERINSLLERLKKAKAKGMQPRISSFFVKTPSTSKQ